MLWWVQTGVHMVPKFLVTGSWNMEGRLSHSLLLFPELDLMQGWAKLPLPWLVSLQSTECCALIQDH